MKGENDGSELELFETYHPARHLLFAILILVQRFIGGTEYPHLLVSVLVNKTAGATHLQYLG
jgi:hypothetical protein